MSLNNIWEGAVASPYYPAVPKERQFLVASSLLLIGTTVSCDSTEAFKTNSDLQLSF